jgi:AdoMet-dependent heme synthase
MQKIKQLKTARPFYWPPTLVARQALSACYFGLLTRWRKLPHWLIKGRKTLPTAAGALGMGCIGFPIHPVWEITSACNLQCCHCHATASQPHPAELSTEEGKRLLEDVAAIDEFRTIVFSGGEPLVRGDIWELLETARKLRLSVSIATNGTLVTPSMAKDLKRCGAANLAIGLDGATALTHDRIRGVPGAFEGVMRGIQATKEAGLDLQLNITLMQQNFSELSRMLALADQLEAQIVLLYHLVPMGRGTNLELSPEQYGSVPELVLQNQRRCNPVVEPTCAPQYWAYLLSVNGRNGWKKKLAEKLFMGCVAGDGLCYIKPNGEVWPCPFIPISGGNLRRIPLQKIWEESEIFRILRHKEEYLRGKCGECAEKRLCGGCRGRAFAHHGDYLAEDPLCFLHRN